VSDVKSGGSSTISGDAISVLVDQNLNDVKLLPVLESYVLQQAKSGAYDFDINRHLIASYLGTGGGPVLTNKTDIIALVLVKALMAAPHSDFIAVLYMLPERLVSSVEPIKSIVHLSTLLETCQFVSFWTAVASAPAECARALGACTGFVAAMRRFVAEVVSSTYEKLPAAQLFQWLNLKDRRAFETEFGIALQAWKWSFSADGAFVQLTPVAPPISSDATASASLSAGASSGHMGSISSAMAAAAAAVQAPSVHQSEVIPLEQLAKLLHMLR